MGYDIRTLANLVLDRADELSLPVTNVHLNKTLYFLHVWHLLKFSKPLTGAKLEAWDYGPVFREVWQQFRGFGPNRITSRARTVNLESGDFEERRAALTDEERDFLLPLIDSYLRRKPFDLVELTHEKGTPWDQVYNHRGRANPGMRITDEMIADYYERKLKNTPN